MIPMVTIRIATGFLSPLSYKLKETERKITNAGWTLGNFCPYNCKHCYSMSARVKGADIKKWMVERIVNQLVKVGVSSINLGGNEPLFTNGPNPYATMLPLTIRMLYENGILVGLTTSGISLVHLAKEFPEEFRLLNDIDVSFDSPFETEHNLNRGANLYSTAINALDAARSNGIPNSIIICAMNWNFTEKHIVDLVKLAKMYDANIRINTLKPIESYHTTLELTPEEFSAGFNLLTALTIPIEVSEPSLAVITPLTTEGGCPCGKNSFRIHSITPDGRIPISPCVYLHDFKIGNLLVDELEDLFDSTQFKLLRQRHANPELVKGCGDCPCLFSFRGGCAARSYLNTVHRTGKKDLFTMDPLCIKKEAPAIPAKQPSRYEINLVHKNYLCTWIGKPK